MIGPVPAGEVRVHAQVERPGRAVELLAAELVAGGRPVLRARAWRMATGDTSAVAHGSADPLPGPETVPARTERPPGWLPGFIDSMEWRWLRGWLAEPGPGTVWARPRVPLVAGEEPSPLQRLALVADSGNGAAAPLDLPQWLFVNTELTLHLHRAPAGEWIAVRGADGRRTDRYRHRLRAAVRRAAVRSGAARRRCWSGRAERRTGRQRSARPSTTRQERISEVRMARQPTLGELVHHLVRRLLAHHRPHRDPVRCPTAGPRWAPACRG